jgi:hypothetical protein
VATGTSSSFSHDAHCPEISPIDCADPNFEIVDHQHHQSVAMARAQVSLSYGFGGGWQAMARLPVDTKYLTIDYTTPDGEPYDPPYGNIHHRNETLLGPGDGQFEIQKYARLGENVTLGGGIGTTVPTGRTEENPYALTLKGETHQHMQMGSGTFDPVAQFSAIWMSHRWGFIANTNGRLPLYDNSKGYRPSPTLALAAGPTYRFTSKTMVTSSLGFRREWQATWDGEPDEMSGLTAIDGAAAIIYRFTPTFAVMVQGRKALAQWSDEVLIIQRFVGTVGVTLTPGGKAR